MPTILVTGGCGYIGSHTVIELLQAGRFDVVSIDNFLNSSEAALDRIEAIAGKRIVNYAVDLCDHEATRAVFRQHPDIRGVIHFAALKSVPDSVADPLLYYHNNLESLVNMLRCCEEFRIGSFIFSSSCSIYGNIDRLPVSEDSPANAISPYGKTKEIGERIISDFANISKHVNSIALRYFNPVGAHPSGLNGEDPGNPPTALVPVITQTASGLRPKMTVYGGDLDTRDGSCIRDYLHVIDIAQAHIKALDYHFSGKNESNYEAINLGSGKGVSVLEAITAFERIAGMKLNYEIGPARAGDVVAIYSDTTKAREVLGWETQLGIDEMIASAWKWQQNLNEARLARSKG